MRNFIGGLFTDRKNAELARKALLDNGIENTAINVLECTHEKEAIVGRKEASGKDVALGAVLGAIIVGGIGALIGALVGIGVIHLPSLEPSGGQTLPFQITWQFMATSIFTGLMFGGVTGIILGVATRLAMARYRKVDTSQNVNKGDLMLAVETDDIRKETKAKMTMKEYGARKFEEFRDTWDTEIWSVAREDAPQAR
jgi:hypothetical protein